MQNATFAGFGEGAKGHMFYKDITSELASIVGSSTANGSGTHYVKSMNLGTYWQSTGATAETLTLTFSEQKTFWMIAIYGNMEISESDEVTIDGSKISDFSVKTSYVATVEDGRAFYNFGVDTTWQYIRITGTTISADYFRINNISIFQEKYDFGQNYNRENTLQNKINQDLTDSNGIYVSKQINFRGELGFNFFQIPEAQKNIIVLAAINSDGRVIYSPDGYLGLSYLGSMSLSGFTENNNRYTGTVKVIESPLPYVNFTATVPAIVTELYDIVSTEGTVTTDFYIKVSIDTFALINAGKMLSNKTGIKWTDNSDVDLNYTIVQDTWNTTATLFIIKVNTIAASATTVIKFKYQPGVWSSEVNDDILTIKDDFIAHAVDPLIFTKEGAIYEGDGSNGISIGGEGPLGTEGNIISLSTFNSHTILAKVTISNTDLDGYSRIRLVDDIDNIQNQMSITQNTTAETDVYLRTNAGSDTETARAIDLTVYPPQPIEINFIKNSLFRLTEGTTVNSLTTSVPNFDMYLNFDATDVIGIGLIYLDYVYVYPFQDKAITVTAQ